LTKNGEQNVYRPGIGGVVGGGGILATTGANLTWWIVFGVVSLVLGVVLFRSARRRPQGENS
jgi:LPXTG-motif cell wall-anchored protein